MVNGVQGYSGPLGPLLAKKWDLVSESRKNPTEIRKILSCDLEISEFLGQSRPTCCFQTLPKHSKHETLFSKLWLPESSQPSSQTWNSRISVLTQWPVQLGIISTLFWIQVFSEVIFFGGA